MQEQKEELVSANPTSLLSDVVWPTPFPISSPLLPSPLSLSRRINNLCWLYSTPSSHVDIVILTFPTVELAMQKQFYSQRTAIVSATSPLRVSAVAALKSVSCFTHLVLVFDFSLLRRHTAVCVLSFNL